MALRLVSGSALLAALLTLPALPVHAQTKASGLPARSGGSSWIAELKQKHLMFPVADHGIYGVTDSYLEPRDGQRIHHALDILAQRGTPILSADSGRVLKLHKSLLGGLMIYTTDSRGRFIYYYAHLDHYRAGLVEGMKLARGDTLGYVGITGNAPANTPHLHFAILRARNPARWSRGTPINPFTVFAR